MSIFNMEPHPKDGKLVDELPNRVVDEEGFAVASFRFYNDAKAYVEAINGNFPCAEYSIEDVSAELLLLNKLRLIPTNDADAAEATIDAMFKSLTDDEYAVLMQAIGRFGKL